MAKRTLDLVGATLLIMLLSPVLVLCAVAIRVDSRGPALYRQVRVGQYGRTFTMLKLRTMVHNADDSLHRELIADLLTGTGRDQDAESRRDVYKVVNDPRVTRIGGLLRATSIDELPQLLNVLQGHMSLVGPRPDVPYAVEHYESWHHRRMDVKPGMTGLWQVSGRAGMSPQEMLRLDVEYVERASLRLDLVILLRTLPAVVGRVGAR